MRGSRCAPPRGRRMPTCSRASRGRAEGAEETPRTRSPAKGGVRESARRNTCHRIADGLKKRVASSSDRGPTMIKALLRHLHGASRPAALHCRRARVLHERASLRHISAPVDASRTPRDLPVAPSRVDSLRVPNLGVAADDGERSLGPGDRGARLVQASRPRGQGRGATHDIPTVRQEVQGRVVEEQDERCVTNPSSARDIPPPRRGAKSRWR